MSEFEARLDSEIREAERQAWNALAHGKYQMFGYWGGILVHLRRIAGRSSEPSPFRELVRVARERQPKSPGMGSVFDGDRMAAEAEE